MVHAPDELAVTVLTTVPQVTATLAPASAAPLTTTPAAFSVALTVLSVATEPIADTAGATVSTTTALVPATPTLPTVSVAKALMLVLVASAGTSAAANVVVHAPDELAVTVLTTVPQVTATLEPASAVPLTTTPAAFSAALTVLSVATELTTAAVGAVESIATVLLPGLLALPTESVATALILVLAASAGISAAANVEVHTPDELAVTVLTTAPQVTATEAPASVVPLTTTPAVFSEPLTMLSEDTVLMEGAVGL